jgi:hypothetical protein
LFFFKDQIKGILMACCNRIEKVLEKTPSEEPLVLSGNGVNEVV